MWLSEIWVWICVLFQSNISGGSRIFPRGGRQLPKVLLFFNFLPKTAWKWKNLDPRGGARVPGAPPLDPPMNMMFVIWNLKFSDEQFHVRNYNVINGNIYGHICTHILCKGFLRVQWPLTYIWPYISTKFLITKPPDQKIIRFYPSLIRSSCHSPYINIACWRNIIGDHYHSIYLLQ